MLGHRQALADYQIWSSATYTKYLIDTSFPITFPETVIRHVLSITEETECNTGNNHHRTGQLVCVVVSLLSLLSAVTSAAFYEEVEEARLAFVSHPLHTSLGLKSMGQPG